MTYENTHQKIIRHIEGLIDISNPENHAHIFNEIGLSSLVRQRFIINSANGAMNAVTNHDNDADGNFVTTIHRMWLTDPVSACQPKIYYLDRIKSFIKRESENIHHMFWVNSEEIRDFFVSTFSAANVEVKSIEDIGVSAIIMNKIKNGVLAKKYVLAGDICKYSILSIHGGIYCDLGVEPHRDIIRLTHIIDFISCLDQGIFFQPSFMSALKGNHTLRL